MYSAARASEPRARMATSAPTRTKQAPAVQVGAGGGRVECVHAGGFASRFGSHKAVFDGGAHPGVFLLSQQAHGGCEVRGAQEDAVHAVDGQDLLHRRGRSFGFDLHGEADGLRGGSQVVRDAVPARGPGQCRANAADPERRVAHGRNGRGCFKGRVHHGNQQVLHAQVQVLLDNHGVIDRRPDHGLDAGSR